MEGLRKSSEPSSARLNTLAPPATLALTRFVTRAISKYHKSAESSKHACVHACALAIPNMHLTMESLRFLT